MSDGFISITRWWIEQANSDFDEGSVDEFVLDNDADVVDIVGEIEGDTLVRIDTSAEIDGEQVDYSVDMSESLLREAIKRVEESDVEFE